MNLLLSLPTVVFLFFACFEDTAARYCPDDDNRPPYMGGGKCDCQRLDNKKRIVGGREADVHEYPFQVHLSALYSTSRGQFMSNCGGTLISSQWILTAGHCVRSAKYPTIPPALEVRVGEHLKSSETETDQTEVFYTRNFIIHEGYSLEPNIVNDIALVRLDQPVQFTDAVSPACLPLNALRNKLFDGEKATATGWGRVDANNKLASDALKELDLKVYSGPKCSYPRFYMNTLGNDKLCGYKKGENVCNGDSGGPLSYKYNGHTYVIGIASYVGGPECAYDKFPGVFVNVAYYLDWIQKRTGERFCSV